MQTKIPDWRSLLLRPFKLFAYEGQQFFAVYETPRIVAIHNYGIAVAFRLLQFCILGYLIGYVFIWTKSYQEFDHAESSVTVKIKGILRENVTGRRIWDAVDFVIPPQEKDSFFIATSAIYTENQSQSVCAEDPNIGEEGIHCRTNRDCIRGEATPYGNGVKTGRCVSWNTTLKTCQINAWCPLEMDENPEHPLLSGFGTITVLVKNHVAFPKFDIKRRNILDSFNSTYLSRCRFDPVDHPLCPVFGVKDMIKFAEEDFMQTAIRGSIISFGITWNCNFDFHVDYCLPKYSFRRLDDKEDQFGKGWNFRHATQHVDGNGVTRRNLIKVWGIRFVFNVNGSAGRFSRVNFAMDVGSGIGLLGVASFVCELLLLRCVRPNTDLVQQKFVKL